MNREEFFYLIPYLISFVMILGVFLYTWRHRHVRGADIYLWFIGGQVLTVLGFIFELVSPALETKLIWDKFQWLTDSFLVFIPFLIFSLRYTETRLRNPRRIWGFWLSFPILFTALLLTNDLHHLIYPDPHLSTDYPFPELKYTYTTIIYLYSLIYIYGVNFYGVRLLIKRAYLLSNPYRLQYFLVAGGFLVPLVFSFFTLLDIRITPQRDIAPFTFAIGNLIVAWGIFRHGLFDIVPIAREHIVESMSDPMIVLDRANRIVDINSAALLMLGENFNKIIGYSPRDVFTTWPDIIEILEKPHQGRREISIETKDDRLFFDINISPILSRDIHTPGWIVVFRDITRQKTMEASYRILSDELEKRVQERTKELGRSEEKFYKVFQASPDAIVLAEFKSGRLVEVNEGFERIFGYQRAEVIGRTPLELDLYADPLERQKFTGLLQKHGRIVNEEFKIVTWDGKEKLVQVAAEPIDINGKSHIVVINRDITEQKQVEARILRLNRLYITMGQINQTIVRERDRATLLKDICRVAIEHGQFRMAWIGLINELNHQIVPVVYAGEEQGYLKNINIETHDNAAGQGPTGTAIRENRCVISQDIETDPRMVPWRERALQRGYRSSAAVPIQEHDRVVGALTVYASEPYAFDEDDKNLLDEIGQDISYALDSINTESERRQAEEALLHESELNAKMAMDIQLAYDETLEGWSHAMDLRDKETEGHTQRVTTLTLKLAKEFNFSEEEMINIKRGALLHDIGKMGIPDNILLKAGTLTADEWDIMRKHPVYAYDMLSRINYLQSALDIPYCHHEKWDGSGYPRGLKGEEIPFTARIFAVVDVWDALSSVRSYRGAWERDKITEYLQTESGKHFDPKIVAIFIEHLRQGEI